MSAALARKLEADLRACREHVHGDTRDLATGLGLEDESELHPQAHKRLAAQLQELAVMDAKLEIKVKATSKVMLALAQEMSRRRASGPAAATAAQEVSMEHFLQRMSTSVSASMEGEGADEKVLQSKTYKDLMKHVTTIQGDDDDDVIAQGNKVSLICPLTSATFKEPVQSKKCKHTFEKGAILNHIKIAKNAKTLAACPVAGCTGKVNPEDLVTDEAMLRRLRIESETEKTGPPIDAEEIDDTVGETYI